MTSDSMLTMAALCLAVGLGACGGGDDSNCPSMSGSWKIEDHCESSMRGQTVSVTQSACAITYASPFTGWTGTIASDGVLTSSGPAGGQTLTCSGTVSGGTANLSCTPGGCLVKLQQQSSGSCADLAGTWTITRHCESSVVGQSVSVTQSGCAITYASPFTGWTGTVDAAGVVTSTGPAGSQTLTCSGTISGGTLNLSCTPGGCIVELHRNY